MLISLTLLLDTMALVPYPMKSHRRLYLSKALFSWHLHFLGSVSGYPEPFQHPLNLLLESESTCILP